MRRQQQFQPPPEPDLSIGLRSIGLGHRGKRGPAVEPPTQKKEEKKKEKKKRKNKDRKKEKKKRKRKKERKKAIEKDREQERKTGRERQENKKKHREKENLRMKELKNKSFIVTDKILRYQRNSFKFSFKKGTTEFLSNC